MKDTMRSKLTQLVRRLEEIDQNLQDPDVTSNMDQFRALSKERAEIEPVVLKAKEYEQAEEDLAAAEEMLSDEEMKEFASEEIKAAKKAIEQISSELEILLLPKDPNDDKNIYLEIRAAQAVTSLPSLPEICSECIPAMPNVRNSRWNLSLPASDLGGYKEIVVKIVGQGAYSKLKFESGGHRVQRVPETESQGAFTPLPARLPYFRKPTKSAMSSSILPNSELTSTAPPAPAVSTFRKQRVLSVLRTFLPALWSSAKTSGASTKTKKEPWAF